MPILNRLPVMEKTVVTMLGVDHESEPQQIGEVVHAATNSDGREYLRMQLESGESYLWSGAVSDFSDQMDMDPLTEPRWVRE